MKQTANKEMKKIYLLGIAATVLCGIQGCTRAKLSFRDPSSDQIIALRVDDRFGAEALGRQVFPAAGAGEPVEQAILYVVAVADGRIVATRRFNDWPEESSESTSGGGRYAEFRLGERLTAGDYRLVAIGYRRDTPYDGLSEALAADGGLRAYGMLALDGDSGAGEFFAGAGGPFTVTTGQGFREEVVMQRQVAGIGLYVREIPYVAGASRLEIEASGENNLLIVDATDPAAYASATDRPYGMVNGASVGASFDRRVLTVDLSEWFAPLGDADGDGIIDAGTEGAPWQLPDRYAGAAAFAHGSVYGGAYVIPFAGRAGIPTLTLRLTTSTGEILRTWAVRLPDTAPYGLYTWNGTDFGFSTPVTAGDGSSFPIVRNGLYVLGEYTAADGSNTAPAADGGPADGADGTDGTNGTNGTNGTDGAVGPVSLYGRQTLSLTAAGPWGIVRGYNQNEAGELAGN